MLPERVIKGHVGNLDARWAYQELADPPISTVHRRVRDLLDLQGFERLLDAGCGKGDFLEDVLNGGHFGQLVGVDLGADMFAATQSRLGQAITFIEGNADRLDDYPDGFFHRITSNFSLPFMDAPKVLKEWSRLLSPDGKLVIAAVQADHLLSGLAYRARLGVPSTYLGFTPASGLEKVAEVFHVNNVTMMPGTVSITDPEIYLATVDSVKAMATNPLPEREYQRRRRKIKEEIAEEIRNRGSYTDNVSWIIIECSKERSQYTGPR